MAISGLYDLLEKQTVTFVPQGATGAPVRDPRTETISYPADAMPGTPIEVFLIPEGQTSALRGKRAGLDPTQNRLLLQVVGTPGNDPLKLPLGVGAGSAAEASFLGRKGKLTIEPLELAQIPDVSDQNGWLYSCTFEAVRSG